jgi:hypothetical protein
VAPFEAEGWSRFIYPEYHIILGDGGYMVHRESEYAELWMRVNDIVQDARRRAEEVVREVCRMLMEDAGELLDELAEKHGFTYVIAPMQGVGDPAGVVPCVYVEGDTFAYGRVCEALRERFPELVSASRLRVELMPRRRVEL